MSYTATTIQEQFASGEDTRLDETKLPKWLYKYLVFRFNMLDRTGELIILVNWIHLLSLTDVLLGCKGDNYPGAVRIRGGHPLRRDQVAEVAVQISGIQIQYAGQDWMILLTQFDLCIYSNKLLLVKKSISGFICSYSCILFLDRQTEKLSENAACCGAF